MHEFGPKPTTTAWSHTPSSEISSLSSSGYSPKSSRRGYNTICVVTPGGVQRHVPHCPNIIRIIFFSTYFSFLQFGDETKPKFIFQEEMWIFFLLVIILKHFLPNINTQALFFLIIILKHFFLHHHVVEETTIKQNYMHIIC